MNKTLTVALSMCAGVAVVGLGAFAQSTSGLIDTSTTSVSDKVRTGIARTLGTRPELTDDQKAEMAIKKAEMQANHSAVQTAVEANNYSLLSTEQQSKISQAKFDTMVARNMTHKAIEAAISTNDYAAFQTAIASNNDSKFTKKEISEAQFAQMVTIHNLRTTHQNAIETAVKNNDVDAYQAEMTNFKATIQANKSTKTHDNSDARSDKIMRKKSSRTSMSELTNAQKTDLMQTRFEKLVDYYNTNGSLPQKDMGRGGMEGKMGARLDKSHGGPKGEFRRNHTTFDVDASAE